MCHGFSGSCPAVAAAILSAVTSTWHRGRCSGHRRHKPIAPPFIKLYTDRGKKECIRFGLVDLVRLRSVRPHTIPQPNAEFPKCGPTDRSDHSPNHDRRGILEVCDWMKKVKKLKDFNIDFLSSRQLYTDILLGWAVHYTKVQGKNTGFTLYISKIYTE